MRDLPEGWFEVALGDVVEPKQTRNPSNDGSETFRYIDVKAVDNTRNRVAAVPEVESRSAPSRARRLVREGDVLFSLVRPYLRNIAVVPADLDGQVASTAFSVLRPNGAVASRFLLHQVLQVSFVDSVPTFGNSPPSAREEDFLSQRIVVAPVREQHRIVAGIEVLFAKLDEAIAALRRTQANLGRYRASVLKAAVEGRLTARWRSENPPEESGEQLLERILAERRKRWEEDRLAEFAAKGRKPPKDWKSKYKEPVAPDASGLPELPEGWCWATVDQVGQVIGGLTKNQARAKIPAKHPYLRVANVYADELRLDDVKTIGVSDAEFDRVLLCAGDLMVVEGNGSPDQIGRVAEWNGELAICCHQNHLIKVRCDPAGVCLPRWLLLWLLSPLGRRTVLNKASSTSGLYTLSLSKLRALSFPVAPYREQTKAVDLADSLRDGGRSAGRKVRAGIEFQSAALRQSILKRAFEGRLVPQDPDDEPATVLLERIRAGREAKVRPAAPSPPQASCVP